MNRLTKFVLILLLLMPALAACSRRNNSTEKAEIVAETAALIADFNPPAGYEPAFGLHALGYTVVAYHSSEGQLYLVQSEEEADVAALMEALHDLAPDYHHLEGQTAVVEERPCTLRNQEVTLIIREGRNDENEPVNQATTAFEGKEGPALLTWLEPADRWDTTAVEAFLASVR